MKFFFDPHLLKSNEHKNIFGSATAKNLDELEVLYGNDSFIEIQKNLNDENIIKGNNELLELLKADLDLPYDQRYTRNVNLLEAQRLLSNIKTSNTHVFHDCYDPKGEKGFCFGEATIGHMEALIRGVHPKSIRKIWIAGDFYTWGHHVANMVHTDFGWVVLDTNLDSVVSVKKWLDFYTALKNKNAKTLMYFVSRAERFGPQNANSYNSLDLFNTTTHHFNVENDFYNGYFHDYFEDLEKSIDTVRKLPVR
jgi:hypothetical protein